MVATPARAVTAMLGAPPVAQAFATGTRASVRVLAYHGIPDATAFAAHLDYLVAHYRPVSGRDVTAALSDGAPLPQRSVWVTFDDGRPEVADVGLGLLRSRAIPATMFVCPGVIDGDEPFWWDVVTAASAAGLVPEGSGPGSGSNLKRVPDAERRSIVADLSQRLEDAGLPLKTPQLTRAAVRAWADAGMEVANHTWDHPCLDQCDEPEQERQITRAHEALADLLGSPPNSFAYPNGNVTAHARAVVNRLGYRLAVDFAHRLCTRSADPLRVPRLRIDADAPLPRFRAIVSGAHSTVFGLRERRRVARNAEAA